MVRGAPSRARGARLPPVDYGHNDLNLSNVLTDGVRITGVVDWDEFWPRRLRRPAAPDREAPSMPLTPR
jgi:hypothetical protein